MIYNEEMISCILMCAIWGVMMLKIMLYHHRNKLQLKIY